MADNQVILTFGGGLNARRRIVDVALDECVAPSENFDLDPQFRALNRRKPFDLVATAPNGNRRPGRGYCLFMGWSNDFHANRYGFNKR